jgi:hypothetical protein
MLCVHRGRWLAGLVVDDRATAISVDGIALETEILIEIKTRPQCESRFLSDSRHQVVCTSIRRKKVFRGGSGCRKREFHHVRREERERPRKVRTREADEASTGIHTGKAQRGIRCRGGRNAGYAESIARKPSKITNSTNVRQAFVASLISGME